MDIKQKTMSIRRVALLAAALVLGACSATSPTFHSVKDQIDEFENQTMNWKGKLIYMEPTDNNQQLLVLKYFNPNQLHSKRAYHFIAILEKEQMPQDIQFGQYFRFQGQLQQPMILEDKFKLPVLANVDMKPYVVSDFVIEGNSHQDLYQGYEFSDGRGPYLGYYTKQALDESRGHRSN